MNNLIPFCFEDSLVRVIDRDGEPWWVLVDVCAVLSINKHRDAASRLDDDERGSVVVDTLGGPQETVAVNESGLWSLVLTSRKPEAKRFKKWLTAEVIPAIRKTGYYSRSKVPPEFDAASWYAVLSRVFFAYRTQGPREARDVWIENAIPFPMPDLVGVVSLMAAALGDDHADGVSGSSIMRKIASRHNGALGGRPRKGETADQARARRFRMTEKEVFSSEDGTQTTVFTYTTEPKGSA